MRHPIWLLFILLCFTPGSLTSASANDLQDQLILLTEEYPPLNFTEDGVKRGIATDLLVEILAATGSLKSHKDIAVLPWASAYRMALKQPNVLLFSMTRTNSRQHLFHWVGPILKSEIVLLARRDSNIKLKSLEDIETHGYRVGVVLEDVGQELLSERGIDKRRLSPSNKGIYLAQMLAEGRVDLIAYDVTVSHWNLRQLGYKRSDFTSVFSLQKADYYYTISLGTDPQIVERLQHEFDRLKTSGRLKQIIESYRK